MTFATRINQAISRTGSVTCVGLDPRKSQLPAPLREHIRDNSPHAWAKAYTQFCCEIIDVVKDIVPCVKPQAAFFEQLGPAGMVSLGEVIHHATQAGLIVITDGKRNDIGSTATAYADAYLGSAVAIAAAGGDPAGASPWGSDALTVSPYLGRDSIEPFVDVCDQRAAGIFVLVKTSNPGGGYLQDLRCGEQMVYQAVAELVTSLNVDRLDADGYGPIGAVVGATYPEQLAELRAAMPHSILLVPGFGAQGGAADDVRVALDDSGRGAVINSSRGIIFAHARSEFAEKYGDAKWQDAVRAATEEMNDQLKS
ncbi:orotidine-5'-phosphate decarboxylase [Allorhodopirellula heiligendammensis]|uniref:Orotidine 5'-phosphate decarboxylase n=1 Tax=Allorhodopirellula heiligendammensis TaxID=2714739 RepID=A0A5C6BTT8_9BACT|nr:orotidine-5'-phosphate decarboxylase [Allorhodopirellula heiligendammensis]TWU15438.1 Orotidine 5'-phosphate decarboxylase [Allorhodopirellula heiligendammensis]